MRIVIMATLMVSSAFARDANKVDTINEQVTQLRKDGKHSIAAPIAERALALAQRELGPDHPSTFTSLSNLASVYQAQGRYNQAEPLFERALAERERVLGPEHADTLSSVNSMGELYRLQARYAEAETFLKRALGERERILGSEHPDVFESANDLGLLYRVQGRYGEAAPLYKRALEGRERMLGPEHKDTLTSVNNLAALYLAQGRHADAEPLYQRVLEANNRLLGPGHSNTLNSINGLASLYYAQGRYDEATPLYRSALEGREKTLGTEHPNTFQSLNNLAALFQAQGRYSEAEPLFNRALTGRERVLGPEHPDTLQGVNNLAGLYMAQGRYRDANPLYRRVLDGNERVLGAEHPNTLASVNNLAGFFRTQGRYGEAEPLYKRVLEGNERLLGPEHPTTLQSVNNLAQLYRTQGRFRDAEPLYKRSFEGSEKVLGPEHPDTLLSLGNLAQLYRVQGRYGDAEPLLIRALAGRERVLGPEHPNTFQSLSGLALLHEAQGNYGEAEPLLTRVLEGRERVLGAEHPDTLQTVGNLARIYFEQGEWVRAAALWRRSAAALARRMLRDARDTGDALRGQKKSTSERDNAAFPGLVKVVRRLAKEGRESDSDALREMFQTAQWTLGSDAAQSLSQMAARGARGDPELAAMVRERQDLVAEWQRRDGLKNAWLGQALQQRNAKAEAENGARLAAIDVRIAAIDQGLEVAFPDYASLASPEPLSVDAVQAQLRDDEALVLFLDTPESKSTPQETFVWVITKADARWIGSGLGKTALTREVQALRCGLDFTAWKGPLCAELTGARYTQADYVLRKPLPFDLARSHKLYKALLGEAEDLIKSKHLLLVLSGPLTQLPFSVLVTAQPKNDDHKAAAWLARDHAITVLPAVSSLAALRRDSRPSNATKPLIGFGNPLLDGPDNRYATLANLAREKQSCPKTAWRRVAGLFGDRDSVSPIETDSGLANVALIRRQAPLPETAGELCAVAHDLNADVSEIRLGARANEHEIKSMSGNGGLAQYRILHFATHGAMAGELSSSSEPGLILTPPQNASEDDDGYLSASEIAALKLDADWVILSACNTAAGNASNAEALSGLARAFFYAQARALLVSHWAVDSNATVKLITSAMREIASDERAGRAEALRRAMLALIDNGDPQEAHPAYWAPFIVVGEGGR